ncbi:MAG: molybdenum ABC transporter ATP-binding protein [Thermoguttaceae bacterium]|jgi:molybdate transport system ATP-binding protein|nr:molybdenum ABC transporter ATP-binding protein [Thermoguttaceae bacterium]
MSQLEFDCRHRFPGGFQLDAAFQTRRTVTALFGPSGSGKTTVLSIIAGFLKPDGGRVTFDGRSLCCGRNREFVPPECRRVGMVFQDHLLFPHLSVLGNLRYARRRPAPGREPIGLEAVVDTLEIGHLVKQYPRQLSGGERQRVALGRALLSQPDLLLMDEPLASLDAALKSRILTYLERVVGQWTVPVLFVSHSQAEVRRLAQWVVMIERGRVIRSGEPDEVLGTPEALAMKNSTAPLNLVRLDRIERTGDHCHGTVGTQRVYVPFGEDKGEVPDPLFVQFSPRDVVLSRRDVQGLSARNHLTGRIRQIVRLPQSAFAAIDIGQIIWAEVTADAVTEMQLELGTEVVCFLKAHNLQAVE